MGALGLVLLMLISLAQTDWMSLFTREPLGNPARPLRGALVRVFVRLPCILD
jgi:hypothetical protein